MPIFISLVGSVMGDYCTGEASGGVDETAAREVLTVYVAASLGIPNNTPAAPLPIAVWVIRVFIRKGIRAALLLYPLDLEVFKS